MKLSTPLSTLSALTSLLSLATANFDVYYMSARAKSNCQGVSGYMVFDGGKEPDCTDVTAAPFHPWLTTSGGNALEHPGGVRCQDQINGSGSGCESLDPIDIEMMEMFFSANPLYRWTIKSDGGYQMVGNDGSVAGQCILFPGVYHNCKVKGVDRKVTRKLRCLTEVTADEITQAYQATFGSKTPKNMAWCYHKDWVGKITKWD